MGKKKNKNGYGKGTFIETKMVLSPAYISLGQRGSCEYVSSASSLVLICLLLKRGFSKGRDRKGNEEQYKRSDDNRFTFTYKELTNKPLNLTQPRATRAIDELLAKGFIEIHDPGGLYEKHKAIYGLVDDWKRWRPGDPPIRKRERDIKRGYQGKGLGIVKKQISHTSTLPTDTHVDVAHPD